MIVPFKGLPGDTGDWTRPVLDVAVAEMEDTSVACLVDSGALNTLLPRWLADAAGLAMAGADHHTLAVAATTTRAAFVTTGLNVGGHTWEAQVGFCDPWPYGWGLLGQLSFFRSFTVTFRTADFELEIEPVRR
ncbi:MAG: aspartyl protease family protein [Acidimicrobiales bacterium]